ncbi:patatin-like phospholipase family protein [Tumebacillus sp. ITR2]|uniref:Patatin-like phospholipase family protein n=1 Tax=Tumebacillus amylolyticus TaxID=2801339 RepID=A0ABS1JCE8_9BACL|nr:patatin-like phospholipase family protein [Tumebacillus amylolyticus]MBL0387951.1 patatin-like phospholipase family protein [Tumebacillus amylolyticus]
MKIGLALSGGTLRGAAHIGVLDVLHEAGIKPDMIAGSSAGSIIASLYAHGLSPHTLQMIATSFPGRKLVDWSTNAWGALRFVGVLPLYLFGWYKDLARLVPNGFIRGTNFERYLSQLYTLAPTHKPIPLLVTTVDLYTTEAVVFTDGYLPRSEYAVSSTVFHEMKSDPQFKAACVRASCSMPGVFTPRKINDRILIDGAIRTNIPADLLFQAGCDRVIVVDLLRSEMSHGTVRTFFDVFMRSWDILVSELTAMQLQDDKLFAISPAITDVGWTSFDKIEYCIQAGRDATREALPKLREYLQS